MTCAHEARAYRDAYRKVHAQKSHSDATDGRSSFNDGTVEKKVIAPSVCSRRKQWRKDAGFWISGSDITAFRAIAVETGVGQVVTRSSTAMLGRDNVIGLMREDRFVIGHTAIFATSPGAIAHSVPQ